MIGAAHWRGSSPSRRTRPSAGRAWGRPPRSACRQMPRSAYVSAGWSGDEHAGVAHQDRRRRRVLGRHDVRNPSRLSLPASSLTLDHELEVDGQLLVHREVRLDRGQVHVDLALVVARAARVELAVAFGGLEWRRLPELERLEAVARRNDRRAVPWACRAHRATRRRPPGGPGVVTTSAFVMPIDFKCATMCSAQRRTSLLCCGWALTLGMRSTALRLSRKRPRLSWR